MRISATLSAYIGRHFLLGFAIVFLGFAALIATFELIELLRRSAARPDVTFALAAQMMALKLPNLAQEAFPFAALLGSILVFWRLTRSNELVVTRAAGVSAWQFLLPVLLLAFVLGVLRIAVTNPVGAAMLAEFQRLEAVHLKGQTSALAISDGGLWLRQASAEGPSVIHAATMLQQNDADLELGSVTVFTYRGQDTFLGRIDADRAVLEDGFWHLYGVRLLSPEKPPVTETEYWIETDLTLEKIQDSFAPPETMSFWDLPEFIATLERAGFSAIRHRLHFHAMLAVPLLMCAMVLIAATFALRHTRRGGTTLVVAIGVLAGFVLYFFSDVVFALGLSERIPVLLAAWSPAGVATLLGVTMVLHLEDG